MPVATLATALGAVGVARVTTHTDLLFQQPFFGFRKPGHIGGNGSDCLSVLILLIFLVG